MNKPIAAIITDTHLKENNIELNKSIFKQAIVQCQKLGLDTLYHGGDIFDSRKAQPLEIQTAFKEILSYFRSSGIKLVVCAGNHDKTNYSAEESFLDAFHVSPYLIKKSQIEKYFEVVDTYEKYYLSNDIVLHLTPFFDDYEYITNIQSFSDNINKKKRNIHLTHIGFEGSVMNNGVTIKGGVGKSIADLFDLTLVGHYHDYQELYDGKVIYIGSAYQANFGEKQTNKGLTLLNDDLSLTLVELDSPKYIKYEVNVENIGQKEIDDLKAEKANSKDIIRVYLTGSDEKVNSFNKQQLLNIGIEVEKKIDEVVKQEIEQEVEKFEEVNLYTFFTEFCQRKQLDEPVGAVYLNKGLGNKQVA